MVQFMQAQIGALLLGNLSHVVAVYNGNGVGQIAERIEVILGRAVSVVHELALAVHGIAVDVVAYVGAGNAHAAPNIGGGAGILGVLGAHAGTAHVIAGAAGGVYATGAARGAGGACAAANNRNVIRAEVAGVALISYLVPAVGLLQYGNGRALWNLGAAGNGAVILARALAEVHVAGGGAGGGSGGGTGIVIAGVVIAGIPAGVPAAAGGIAGVIIVAAGIVVGQSDLEVLGAEVAGVAAIDYLVPAVVAACVLKQGNGSSLGDLRAARHLAVIGAGALAEVDCSGGNGGADGLIGSHVAGIVIVVIIVIAAGKVAPAAGPVAGIAAGGIAAGPAHGRRTAAGGAGTAVGRVNPAHAGNVYLTAGGGAAGSAASSAAGSAASGAAAAGYANIALENVAYVVARSYLIIAVLLAGYGNGGVGGQFSNALGGAAGFRAQAHPVGAVVDNAGGVSGGGS